MQIKGSGTGLGGLSAILTANRPASGSGSAGLSSLVPPSRASLSSIELEKHLLDVKKGLGGLSRQTALTLSDFEDRTSRGLSPNSLADYLGYLGAFSYDKRARFVKAINDAVQLNSTLNETDRLEPAQYPARLLNLTV